MNYKELWDELKAVIKDQQAFNARQLLKAKDEKDTHLRKGEIFEDQWILWVMEDLEAEAKRKEQA